MEFMVMLGLLLFVFIALQMYIFTKMNEASAMEGRARIREVCDGLASQLTLAGYAKNYSGSFKIPFSGAGTNYEVAVYDENLVLDYQGQSCVSQFRAGAVRFNGSAPPFTLQSGEYWINNAGGVVYIARQ